MAHLVWWRMRPRSGGGGGGGRRPRTRRARPGRRRRWILGGVALALTVVAALPWGVAQVRRTLYGVEPGVTLNGEPMGRLLPEELRAQLLQLGEAWRVEPVDARYDTESGTVTPEVIGRRLAVEATAEKLWEAPAASDVSPSWVYQWPRVRAAHFQPLFRGPADEAKVALAVNVDWGEEVLPSMLETLRELGVHVTFFPTGRWAKRFPELTARLARAGHEIGTHGMRHDNPVKMDRAAFQAHVAQGAAIVERLTGQMPRLYAPPSGEWDEAHVRYAAEMGYRTVMWTVDTVDWKGPSAEQIMERVLTRVKDGAIILMHPKPATAQALPGMVRGLRERGYEIVPVGRLADLS